MYDSDNKQLKVAMYLRVSTDDQAKNYGLDMQEEAIRAYIKSKGKFEDGRDKMVLAGDRYIYKDDGVSGTFDVKDRAEFSRLIEDLTNTKPKPFDIIAVYKIDRFARRLKVLLEIIELFEKSKVQFVSVNESIDTSTPFGRAILGIMGVIAELELETIKKRTEDGKTQAIEQGTFMGSPPFGYKKDAYKRLVIFEPEAKYVQQIFHLAVFDGKNPKEIADIMTTDKVLSPEVSAIKYQKKKGKSRKINDDYFWRPDTVRDVLSNELYTGKYYHNKTNNGKRVPREKWQLSRYRYPQIIEDSVFIKAQELLQASASKTLLSRKPVDSRLYLLSGLLKCGYCSTDKENMHTWNGDRKEVGRGSGNYSYYYRCGHKNPQKYSGTCPTIPIPAEQLETYVISFIKNLLRNPEAAYQYQLKLNSTQQRRKHLVTQREKLVENINNVPMRETNLKSQHEHGIIDDGELMKKLTSIGQELTQWQKELKEIDTFLGKYELSMGYVQSFNQYAKRYSKALEDVFNHQEEVYNLIHTLIDKIVVYTRPFNPKFDTISGRKKDNQQIPYSITIRMKLPRSLMLELAKQEAVRFGVKTDNL